jgi:hypothetical protein
MAIVCLLWGCSKQMQQCPSEYGRAQGIRVIDGGCPLMFAPTADPGHKAMRLVFTLTGKVPRQV